MDPVAIVKHVLVVVDSREATAGRKKDGVDLVTLWQERLRTASVPYTLAMCALDIGDVAISVSDVPFVVPEKYRFHKGVAMAALPGPFAMVPGAADGLAEAAPFPPPAHIVVERKALADLVSSYGDGRYADQKARLINCDAKQVVLLVEGFASAQVKDPKLKKTLMSTFVHTMFRDGISVYHTRTIQESFEWIDWTCSEMARGKLERQAGYMERTKYTDKIHASRKANLTPERGLELQLASIPGVSAKMARAVSDVYSSMAALCVAYESVEESARPNLLADLQFRGDSGKYQRLATRSQKIHAYIYGVAIEPATKKTKKEGVLLKDHV